MIEFEFLITSLIVILIPGTGVIYTISIGVSQNWKSSIIAAFGCTLGVIPHLAATVLGLSSIIHMSAKAFHTIKFVGAIYLVYLAWLMWHETGKMEFNQSPSGTRYSKIILKGILINLLNPKLTIFFFAFLPQFISSSTNNSTQALLLLGSFFMAMTFAVFVLYGVLASKVKHFITHSPKAMQRLQRSFSAIFVYLAAKLVLSEQ